MEVVLPKIPKKRLCRNGGTSHYHFSYPEIAECNESHWRRESRQDTGDKISDNSDSSDSDGDDDVCDQDNDDRDNNDDSDDSDDEEVEEEKDSYAFDATTALVDAFKSVFYG